MQTAVYIANDCVSAVCGKMSASLIHIRKCCRLPLTEGAVTGGAVADKEAVKAAIKELWRQNNLPAKGVTLVLGGKTVSHKLIHAPSLSVKKMQSFVATELSFADNFSETVTDYSLLEKSDKKNGDGGCTILACAADAHILRDMREMFYDLGITLSRATTSLDCRISLAAMLENYKHKTFVICSAEADQIELALFIKGKYRFCGSNRLGCERGSPELADDISSMLLLMNQFNKSQKSGSDITDVLLCGFDAAETENICRLEGQLGMNITPLVCDRAVAFEMNGASIGDYVCLLGALGKERG